MQIIYTKTQFPPALFTSSERAILPSVSSLLRVLFAIFYSEKSVMAFPATLSPGIESFVVRCFVLILQSSGKNFKAIKFKVFVFVFSASLHLALAFISSEILCFSFCKIFIAKIVVFFFLGSLFGFSVLRQVLHLCKSFLPNCHRLSNQFLVRSGLSRLLSAKSGFCVWFIPLINLRFNRSSKATVGLGMFTFFQNKINLKIQLRYKSLRLLNVYNSSFPTLYPKLQLKASLYHNQFLCKALPPIIIHFKVHHSSTIFYLL
ncbi:hypothetical protein DVH24_038926 [Malus domestica]|uniref:Uncharacterized protein n=1 Tax=Malus domestica TaxID=3750 RepID=A0A498KGC3_MALDO|nr:hypothetical protein DVH24_038926 [Malus domestica]